MKKNINELVESLRLLSHDAVMYLGLSDNFYIDNPAIDPVFSFDGKGKIVYCNDCVKELLGYTKKAFLGKSFTELVHPDYVTQTNQRHNSCQMYCESKLLCVDGSYVDVNLEFFLIHDCNFEYKQTMCFVSRLGQDRNGDGRFFGQIKPTPKKFIPASVEDPRNMNWLNIIPMELVVLDFKPKNKKETYKEIVNVFLQNKIIKNKDEFYNNLLKKESSESLVAENGIVVLEASSDTERLAVCGVFISKKGIKFDSKDGKLVHIIVVSTGNAKKMKKSPHYLKNLATFATAMRNKNCRKQLRQQESVNDLLNTLKIFDRSPRLKTLSEQKYEELKKKYNNVKNVKYILTVVVFNCFYDGDWYDFSVVQETKNLKKVNLKMDEIVESMVEARKKEDKFHDQDVRKKKSYSLSCVNSQNNVIRRESRVIGGVLGTWWEDRVSFEFDIIQVPKETKINKKLFTEIPDVFDEEVVSNFFSRRKKWEKV